MVIDGPINGEIFRVCVERVLVPTLRPVRHCRADQWRSNGSPSSSWTTSAATRAPPCAAIEAAGAELRFLPPYSPDFNPIENAFSKLKALLRKAAARTRDALWTAVADALDAFTPDERGNYFTAAG
jgi:transposase